MQIRASLGASHPGVFVSPTPPPDERKRIRPSLQRQGRTARLLDCTGMAALSRHAAYLGSLDQALRKTLPKAMQSQVRLASIQGRRMIFLAPSPAWASRLRTLQQPLFSAARSLGLEVDSISVKMSHWVPPELEDTRPRKTLSAASAHHLATAAAHVADPQLRKMFLELAERALPRPPGNGGG
ncbi:DciA family protein [Frateuria aurantia]